jgi:hypothetical protein
MFGEDVAVPKFKPTPKPLHKSFNLKSISWDGAALLSGQEHLLVQSQLCDALTRKIWTFPSFRELLWHELCSEHDSVYFYQFAHQSRINFSPEYQMFEKAWLEDEWRHHTGFKFLYTHFFDQTPDAIHTLMNQRNQNFSDLAELVTDEFSVCVLLAYDEAVTAKAYSMDYPIYDSLNNRNLSKWIRLVARDEVYHCRNLVELIRRFHNRRLGELAATLDRIVDRDRTRNGYGATFVLDHEGFPSHLLETARTLVLKGCGIV